jgi:hypothetical protein
MSGPMASHICLALTAALIAAAPGRSSISLRGVPPPQAGESGRLSFEIRDPWMEGYLEMRFPETLRSSLGLHFIDHDRPDMPPLSRLAHFPAWQRNAQTGALSYRAATKEGVEFSGLAVPEGESVRMEFRVKNATGRPLKNVSCQMCLVLTHAPAFAQKLNLTPFHAWIGGEFTSLDQTIPTPLEIGRKPWILLLTRDYAKRYRGPRQWPDGWWVVNQTADRSVLARISADKEHLVAVAWDETDSALMTNTMIPCLHAGPTRAATIAPSEEAVWRGSIYLIKNDPELLRTRHERDRARRLTVDK